MMSVIKVIKTEQDHAEAMARLMALMDQDPAEGSDEDNELEVLSVLIEQYENIHFPIDKPHPVEAIKFRMEQQGLTRKDMVTYFGSQSRVSEVLNGKRALSLGMIRKLHHGLGIPADVLIQDAELARDIVTSEDASIDWHAFPLKNMLENGYFSNSTEPLRELKLYAEDRVRDFLDTLKGSFQLSPAMMRTSAHLNNNDKQVNPLALWAWQVKVLKEVEGQNLTVNYQRGTVDAEFMTRLAKESWSNKGPLIAKEFLANHGIHLIIEPHLEKTYLDGAVCMSPNGNPVIALTLRHDRLDNFWFTLMHELAHIALHFDGSCEWFLDDLDIVSNDHKEDEANAMARDCLIPGTAWNLDITASMPEMLALAKSLSIAPAIVFGRFAKEHNQWKKVRKQLTKVSPLFLS